MNCNPTPEVTCGTTIPETCVTIVDNSIFSNCPPWVLASFNLQKGGCYRQSDFNHIFGAGLCYTTSTIGKIGTCVDGVYTPGEGILGSIYLGCINNCEGDPISGTVRQAIIDLYGEVCALKLGLDISIGDIDPKCLVDPCGPPITTLGPLLQALIDSECDEVGTTGVYRALLTSDPAGVLPPTVTILENSLKFGNIILIPVWTRTGAGTFVATVGQPIFITNKVFSMVGNSVNGITAFITRTSTTTIEINTGGSDSGLVESSVEIRIYP